MKILPFLLTIAFVLSGCLAGDDDDIDTNDEDSADGHDGHGDDDGQMGDAENGGNETGGNTDVPSFEAQISANITAGTAPLGVNFTLETSGSLGDELSWELAFGDNDTESGSELPATVNHTYEEAGNHTAVFTVSSEDITSEANITIEVEETALGPNQLYEGQNSDCLDALALYLYTDLQSPEAVEVPVEAGTQWAGTASEGRMTVDFYRENDSRIENQEAGGTVPDEAVYGLVCVRMDTGPGPAQGATWTYQDGFPVEEDE